MTKCHQFGDGTRRFRGAIDAAPHNDTGIKSRFWRQVTLV